ncbi:FMN-binding negative transcriptional regulator [Arcanobacterium buesumense]|uniref:FMN-binding negative transcriptional regulator n=1 Tax=Arcanobacterium buesumense TaxID=2722751 RepID=A0A6H2EJB6_9ACTO|nr:FMN-binding negative transcriptional regulator [Arcanobacterium buesumense]QJC21426.1 FMN-binding negative transcriptional regulator [Arcanobacterium buesumense]
MYVAHQHMLDPQAALAYASRIGVGELITTGKNGINATRVPFVVVEKDGKQVVQAHLNRVNPQVHDSGDALLIVTGADAHVPGHYLPPEKPGSVMPTAPSWDYVTIHIRGAFHTFDDDAWKHEHWQQLVAHHEPVWTMADSQPHRIQRAYSAIVGMELAVTEVVGKAKLHQNLSSSDLANLADSMEAGGAEEVARLMRDISIPWAQAREARVGKALDLRAKHEF